MNPNGRPLLPAEARRDQLIAVPVRLAEKNKYGRASQRCRIPLAEWVRRAMAAYFDRTDDTSPARSAILTADERAEFTAKAERLGLSFADFARKALREYPEAVSHAPGPGDVEAAR